MSRESHVDITILDAEPGYEPGVVDALIDLQRQTFIADTLRDHGHVANLYLEMAGKERTLGNNGEAIGYTQDAATAFEKSDDETGVHATLGTLSREYRLANAPNLALDALRQGIARLTRGDTPTITVTDTEAAAIMLHKALETYRRVAAGTKHLGYDTELAWARVLGEKVQLPSSAAMGEVHEAVDGLANVKIATTDDWDFHEALNAVRWAYIDLASKGFGLSRRDSKRAYVQSKELLAGMAVVYAKMPEGNDALPFMRGWSSVSIREFVDHCYEHYQRTMKHEIESPSYVHVPLYVKIHRSRKHPKVSSKPTL